MHAVEGVGIEGLTSTGPGQSPGGWEDRQQGSRDAVINGSTPTDGTLLPTPVTPERERREMAKCLLGPKKLLRWYKW